MTRCKRAITGIRKRKVVRLMGIKSYRDLEVWQKAMLNSIFTKN